MFSEHKASPFDLNPHGGNALHYAGNHKDYRTSQFLITQGADPNLLNETGRAASELLLDYAFARQFNNKVTKSIEDTFENTDYMEIAQDRLGNYPE